MNLHLNDNFPFKFIEMTLFRTVKSSTETHTHTDPPYSLRNNKTSTSAAFVGAVDPES